MGKKLAKYVVMVVILAAIGVGLNRLVMSANNGRMPVYITPYCPKTVQLLGDRWVVMTDKTAFRQLGDIIPFGNAMHSIGDMAIYFSLLTPVFYLYKRWEDEKTTT